MTPRGRVQVLARTRDDDLDTLAEARAVVGIGQGVAPDEYPALEPLLESLGAELAATRKVTDRGWLPRSRQVGITGRTIAPRLYLAIGASGKFNHMVGVRAAGTVLAVNADPGRSCSTPPTSASSATGARWCRGSWPSSPGSPPPPESRGATRRDAGLYGGPTKSSQFEGKPQR